MIHDLDDTLKGLLQQVGEGLEPPPVLQTSEVNLLTPTSPTVFESKTLNLYLHRARENRELRDVEPVVKRSDGRYTRHRPPLRLDCEYVVTAWSRADRDQQIREEHELLSAALQWFSRFPEIPESRLRGSLATSPFSHPTMSAQMGGTGNIGEFWSAMGTPPRPSFDLVVTIALPREQQDEGPLVITKEMRMRVKGKPDTEETWYQIGGEVFDRLSSDRDPVSGANVTLRGARNGESETTDGKGRFSFSNLSEGDYQLEVTAAGFVDDTKNITIPVPIPSVGQPPKNYDVGLVPVN